jgi:RNA polymerase sigma-70 factor (ECF subfamily)
LASTDSAALTSPEDLEERRWVVASQRGDLAAFNCLVERHQGVAYATALRLLGNTEDAADVTQDAFLSAYRAIGSFRGGSFRAWLLRIVVNAGRDLQRRWQRRPAQSLDLLSGEDDVEPWADPRAEDPETAVLSGEARRSIEQALAELPEDQRLCIVLVDVQGLSYEEASLAMGCPVGTVRSRLSRARARVRDALLASGNLKQ